MNAHSVTLLLIATCHDVIFTNKTLSVYFFKLPASISALAICR